MVNQKSKMVSFRLSDEEYTRMRQYCILIGVRSLSEMARVAMERLIDTQNANGDAIHEQVRNLRNRIRDLSSEVERIGHIVEHTDGHSA